MISTSCFPETRLYRQTLPHDPHTAVFPILSILINALLTGLPLSKSITERFKLPVICCFETEKDSIFSILNPEKTKSSSSTKVSELKI